MYTTLDNRFTTIKEAADYTVKRGSDTNRLYVEIDSGNLYNLLQGLKINSAPRQFITTESLRVIQDIAISNGGKQILVGNDRDGFMKVSKENFLSHPTTLAVNRKI